MNERSEGKVALCLDAGLRGNPELLGLAGERLDAQSWLEVFSEGGHARAAVKADGLIGEAWVLGCDDVEPINLAAALKADRPGLTVRLVTSDGCGSLFSRAHTAGIDEVLDQRGFLRRYAEAKRSALEAPVEAGAAQQPQPASHDVGERASVVVAPPPAAQVLEPPVLSPRAVSVERQAREAPAATAVTVARKGFLLPVVSGSGGAGKSSVATLAAHAASRKGLRTLLLDCDLQFGDVGRIAGVESFMRIDEALAHPDQMEREWARAEGLMVLAAPERLESSEAVIRELPDFLARLLDRFDVVVANTGASWSEEHAMLLERCSAALFLVDQRATSLHACLHALDLCARCGIASGPFRFALNRCGRGAPLSSADVSAALQGAQVFELKEGGREVEECLSGGVPLDLLEGSNDFAGSVAFLVDQLLPQSGAGNAGAQPAENAARTPRRRGRLMGRKRGRRS